MKALQQIIKRVAENPSQPWALATLVQTEGSTYRKPGARMLVERNGKTLGVLSGGCLEEEIGRYGRRVINDGSAVLLSFDTRLLYGCDGRLKIFVEPLPAAGQKGNLITTVGRLLAQRDVCRIRTCFEGGPLGSELLPPDILLTERPGIFIDTLPLPVRLLLFGSGPEIEPLTQLAGNLGWLVEHFGHPSELGEDFRPDVQTAALIMNHNFGRDLLALDRLVPFQLRYVGLLGPRKRHAELLARLSEYRPLDFNAGARNLFAPAGLDIGSEAPEEIALSITSEIAAVLSDRRGGFLCERKSDIHATNVVAAGGEAA
jgi:xanthine dehydrogenase accessory factor